MRLLITGGAGFIGSFLVKEVNKAHPDWEVIVLDKLTYAGDLRRLEGAKFQFVKKDVAGVKPEDLKGVDAVAHLAAETHVDRSIQDPQNFVRTNVLGTYALLEAAKNAGVSKFLYVSTDEVYGEVLEGEADETWPTRPSSPYSASKLGGEALALAYWRTYGFPALSVRPSNAVGPFQYPEKFIPVIVTKALRNEKIPVYGDGRQVREWLWVEDMARGMLLLLEKGAPGEIYNLGSGERIENIQVVKFILKVLGKSEELISFVKDRPGHDRRYATRSDKIKRLGWEKKVGLWEALERTAKWFAERGDWWREKLQK